MLLSTLGEDVCNPPGVEDLPKVRTELKNFALLQADVSNVAQVVGVIAASSVPKTAMTK